MKTNNSKIQLIQDSPKYPAYFPEYDGSTINNTTIQIDKTIKDLLKNHCDISEKSMYKIVNLIVFDFISDCEKSGTKKEVNKLFNLESSLINLLNINLDKRQVPNRKGIRGDDIKISESIPRKLWIDFCKVVAGKRITRRIAIATAMHDYIAKIDGGK